MLKIDRVRIFIDIMKCKRLRRVKDGVTLTTKETKR